MTMENQCPRCGEVYEGDFHMCRDEQEHDDSSDFDQLYFREN